MLKNLYKVPVVWSMMGYVFIDAVSGKDAMDYVKEHIDSFSLPMNGTYLDDSFEVDDEGEAILVHKSSGNDSVVDRIAGFLEDHDNWHKLKNCWLVNGRSDDLRHLLEEAMKG